MDVTHDWASSSCSPAESLGSSASPLQVEYNSATFKSYETSFNGFIHFVKKSFGADSPNTNIDQEHMYFLLYWFNKHVFPNKSKGVKVE